MAKLIKIIVLLLLTTLAFLFFQTRETRNFNEKPKILFTNFHPHSSGGHLPFIKSILTSDLKSEFEFAVAVPETSDIYAACQELGVKIYPCDFPGKFKELPQVWTAFKQLREIYKDYKPDIIHTNGGHDNTLVAWSALLLAKDPVIVRTYHATKTIGKDPYHWLLYDKLIDANMFVSQSAYRLNIEKGGLDVDNVYVVENGVDLDKFAPQEPELSLKSQLNIPDNFFVFGSSAGTSDYKRIDLMIDALTHFPKDAAIRVIVLGHNPERWIAQAKQKNVDHFIHFVGYHEDVRPYCSLFDVGFILSTRVETSSFASREMLAMGIPLISSAFSGLKDNVDDHVNGIFVEPGNVEDIVNAMNTFLNMSPSELAYYKKNARLKAEAKFSSKLQFQAIKNLYYDMLNKSKVVQSNQTAKTPKLSSSIGLYSSSSSIAKSRSSRSSLPVSPAIINPA